MCIFHEKKKRTVRRSTIEIIENSIKHNDSDRVNRVSKNIVSISKITPIINDIISINNSSSDSGNEDKTINEKNSSSDISDKIDDDYMLTYNDITKRTSFDDIYNARNFKSYINKMISDELDKWIVRERERDEN